MNRDDFLNWISINKWSNAACIGYAIKTCKVLDYSDKEINAFINTLSAMFSNVTLEEAEEEYRRY